MKTIPFIGVFAFVTTNNQATSVPHGFRGTRRQIEVHFEARIPESVFMFPGKRRAFEKKVMQYMKSLIMTLPVDVERNQSGRITELLTYDFILQEPNLANQRDLSRFTKSFGTTNSTFQTDNDVGIFGFFYRPDMMAKQGKMMKARFEIFDNNYGKLRGVIPFSTPGRKRTNYLLPINWFKAPTEVVTRFTYSKRSVQFGKKALDFVGESAVSVKRKLRKVLGL